MKEIGEIRLMALRAFYLLTGVSFAALASLDLFTGSVNIENSQSIIRAVLYAVALLAIAGVLQPLKMLPLLFFSLAWKSIWIVAFAIPMYAGSGLDEQSKNIILPILMGLIVTAIVIPWKYTASNYLGFRVSV